MTPPLTSPERLEGDGVALEPLSLAHLDELFAAASGPRETFALTHVPVDRDATRAYIEQALRLRDARAAVAFATRDLRSDRVVGSTRFGALEYWAWPDGSTGRADGSPDAAEIGWTWLSPEAQRTHVNTAAKLLMLTYAFDTWRVARVTLKTDVRNARSRAGIERVGGRLDGVLRAHSPAADGGARDVALYSILAIEWPALAASLRARLARGASRPAAPG